MQGDGRRLEDLVATFEKHLLTPGFSVTQRECLIEDGVQLAEFDIVIEGPVGSGRIKWLIECRDRPSDKSTEASWIQQLAGRKQQFGFDQIFAVSTSPFSNAAKKAADSLGVKLRQVRRLGDLATSFNVQKFALELGDQVLESTALMVEEYSEEGRLIARHGEFVFHPAHDIVLRYPVEIVFYQDGKHDIHIDLKHIPTQYREGTISLYRQERNN
jgi:hypothetical protein